MSVGDKYDEIHLQTGDTTSLVCKMPSPVSARVRVSFRCVSLLVMKCVCARVCVECKGRLSVLLIVPYRTTSATEYGLMISRYPSCYRRCYIVTACFFGRRPTGTS